MSGIVGYASDMRRSFCFIALLAACASPARDLADCGALDQPLIDLGWLAPGQQASGTLSIYNPCPAEVEILDATLVGEAGWSIPPEWRDEDCDGDQELDCQLVAGTSTPDAAPGSLEIHFEAGEPGASVAFVQLQTTSTIGHELSSDGEAAWFMTARVVVEEACANIEPRGLDFGEVALGEKASGLVQIENCGRSLLALEEPSQTGSGAFAIDAALPDALLPGEVFSLEVSFSPTNALASEGGLVLGTEAGETEVLLVGNDCDPDSDPDCRDGTWTDDDGDGWTELEGDCDDADPTLHPGAEELMDEIDNDCDGVVDDGSAADDDGDGHAEFDSPSDCHDGDPWVHPGATELCDGYDNDCDGVVDDGACAEVLSQPTGEPGTPGGCGTAPWRAAWIPLLGALWIARSRRYPPARPIDRRNSARRG